MYEIALTIQIRQGPKNMNRQLICRNWYEIQKHYHKMSFHIFPLLKILKERWGFEEQYFSWITVFEFWFQFCSNSKTCTICTSHFACGSHRLRFHLQLQQCCWNHFGNHRCIWTRFFYYYLYPYEDLGCLPKKMPDYVSTTVQFK